MNFSKGLVSVAAATVLSMSPALAQQDSQGAGSADQVLQQEQAQGSGASLQLSPSTVRQIQQALNNAGYDVGQVDGAWGPNTQSAVQNFQQAQGLEPTGQPNRRTLSALGVQPQGGGASIGGGAGGGAGAGQAGGQQGGQGGQQQGAQSGGQQDGQQQGGSTGNQAGAGGGAGGGSAGGATGTGTQGASQQGAGSAGGASGAGTGDQIITNETDQ